ncbi:MAG: hypothetical protein WKF84_17955 [Pyrinomonadaceae bacterium]
MSREAQQQQGETKSADKSDGVQTPQQRTLQGNNAQKAEESPTAAAPVKTVPTPKVPAPPSPNSETAPE